MIEIDNLDDSFSIIAEGCDQSFLDQLAIHLIYARSFFSTHGIELDETIEQLKTIKSFITTHRDINPELHTRAFFQGLVAYCGELVCAKIPGEWAMMESNPIPKYPAPRYFPVVADIKNQTYSFSAAIEVELAYLLNPDLNWDKMDGLHHAVMISSLIPDLPPREPGAMPLPF